MDRRLLAPLTALLLALGAAPALANERLVEVPLSEGLPELALLEAKGFDVTHDVTRERASVVLADDAELAALRALLPVRVRDDDYGASRAAWRAAESRATRAAGRSALPSGRERYRVLSEYDEEMAGLVGTHPGLVRPVVLGKTFEGDDIKGLELASQVGRTDDGRPAYVVMGAHHAREWPSAEVNMEFALDLARGYGTDPRITALLDRVRVFVIPVVNRDGFVVSRGTDPAAAGGEKPLQRKNCKPAGADDAAAPCGQRLSTDLNRNYSAFWGGNGAATQSSSDTYRGPGPFSEPESQAVHAFSQGLHITNFQTIHNLATVVLRPPGFSAQGLAPDEPALKALGDAMAEAAGYASEYGFELYEVTGATEDWNYASQNAFGYTIELGGRGSFQGPYATNVVDQYLGTPGTGSEGRGVREALLLAGEQAADPAGHAVLSGEAPAGRVLRLRKEFITKTSERCIVGNATNQLDCGPRLPALELEDVIDTTMTVPADGRWTWHVNPSTRPFVRKANGTEAWTMTCETAEGTVLNSQSVVVGIGEALPVDACSGTGAGGPVVPPTEPGPTSPGPTAPGGDGPGATPPAQTTSASTTPATPPTTESSVVPTASAVFGLAVDRTSRRRALDRGIRVRARCSTACTVSARLVLAGKPLGAGKLALRDGQRRSSLVRLSRTGKARVRAVRAGRAKVSVVLTARVDGQVVRTVRRTVTL